MCMTKNTMQSKLRKFERDTCDYKFNSVYTRTDERSSARKWRKRRMNITSSERTSIDLDNHERNNMTLQSTTARKNKGQN